VYCLPREVLRKRDHHCISTKFWLGVIRWVHELFKRPLYNKMFCPLNSMCPIFYIFWFSKNRIRQKRNLNFLTLSLAKCWSDVKPQLRIKVVLWLVKIFGHLKDGDKLVWSLSRMILYKEEHGEEFPICVPKIPNQLPWDSTGSLQ